jgi:signal transduction histidine kinase
VGSDDRGPIVAEDDFPAAAILLVDDHRPNLLALEVVLEPLGHELVLANSAREALERASEREFAVIVTDVRMPGLDGFDLVLRLRARTSTPVVMMSAVYDDRETVHRAYSLGAVDFIAKPFDPDLVRWRVGALASLYRRGEELKRRAARIAEQEDAAAAAATKAAAAAEEAEQKLGRKDRLVGVLGHDLRNPLAVVLLALESLARGHGTRESDGETAKRGLQAAKRMRTMVQDILDFARAAGGRTFPIRRRAADLAAVARMVVEETKATNPLRAVLIEAPDLLEADCDPDRIAQVMSNLVANAIQHGQGPVTMHLRVDGDHAVMSIHNGGEPIPDEALGTVFEPFTRANHASDGLGLGLHIVREIIRAHGGSVTVRSSRPDGTTFEAIWPLGHRPSEREHDRGVST